MLDTTAKPRFQAQGLISNQYWRSANITFALRFLLPFFWLSYGTLVYAAGGEGDVTLFSAVEIPTTHGKYYCVAFDYSFPGRRSVYIENIGTVSPHGHLAYMMSSKTIRFFDRYKGKTIHRLRIKNPTRYRSAFPIPQESDFPQVYRQGQWVGKKPFADVALSVLDDYFPNGYRAYNRTDRQHFLTMYSTIPPVSSRVKAQVAVLISSPVGADPYNLTFRLRFNAQERRSHSEWRDELSEDTQSKVQKFVDDIFTALQNDSNED
jgi:hypothetical protein